MVTKGNLINMLRNGIINITFTKKDGSERTMKCTLVESMVKPYEKKTDKVKEVDENIVAVWDIEKEAWRSFRYDSVINVYK